MRLRTVAAALLVLATATGAAGQECEAINSSCFELWIGCGDIDTLVVVDENTIGVREADVENAVESRLRAAGVYTANLMDSDAALEVDVRFTDSGAFDVRLQFRKPGLRDEYGFMWSPPSWSRDTFGTHGGRASEVMEPLRRFLDEFMNDYLRVNAPACAAR